MSELIVLIPHYNNPEGLLKSILSIEETINADILVVDDGSKIKPNFDEINTQYKYGRVFIEMLPKNKGIEHALNHGLNVIEKKGYSYIARLDCGDLNKKNKYTKQYHYLQENPDIYLLGTWADMVKPNGELLYTLKHPISHLEIKNKMYLNSMFIHPSVVFKSEVIKLIGLYPTNFHAAEDYAFFFKIVKKLKSENYPEALLIYEVSTDSISSSNRKLQVKNRIKVILNNFYIGFYPIYGLLRNMLLYFMPIKISSFLKQKFK